MKQKFQLIFIINFLLIILFMGIPGRSQITDDIPKVADDAISPADPFFDKEVLRGINLTFGDRFEESLAIFDSLIKIFPNHPAPYFFKAAAYQNWMSAYRFNKFQDKVEYNVQMAIDKGNELLKAEHDAWLHFYIGAAYGYRGFNRFRKHNWIGAYRDGQKGIDNFKEALKADSSLYDVYLGLGSYHYWRTAKSKFLRIIAFWMPDKRDLGIRQLKFAIDHGRYSIYESSYVLVAAYFDYKRYNRAYELLDEVMSRKSVPNIADLYFHGRLMAQFERWPEVNSDFRSILAKIENYKYPSYGFQAECKYWIAKSLYEQKENEEALRWVDESVLLSEKRNEDAELDGHIEDFNEIKDKIKELREELIKGFEKSD